MPNYTSTHTGSQIDSAITKALNLDDFEYITDEVIGGVVYHTFWKVKPTASNSVQGFAVHPTTGKLYMTISVNGTKSVSKYVSETDTATNSEIDNLF